MPVNSLIVGVDLSPIKPIPKVITFQSDITTEKCRATIRQHLKTWKADTVLHDGAPNVGTSWNQDSFNQAELALQSLKLATEFLIEGGTFVTKVFRSKDYNPLLWVLNQLFEKVEATKPPSSRNVSAEIFVVCLGYKAPKRVDPRFLDPRSVFAELSGVQSNNEAKVYNPEVKKRKRDGYEEGDYTLYKEVPASEFIQTMDPIAILGTCNKLTFDQPLNGDVALAALDKLPDTTPEIRDCCADLKTLGRKDFKLLLKWRTRVREIFGFATKESTAAQQESAEVVAVEPMDEELRIQEDLQAMKDKESSKRKKERRKENEKKQKEIVRMQLHMISPMDIGLEEAGPIGEGAMFSLKKADTSDAMRRLNKGKMVVAKEEPQPLWEGIDSDDQESDSEEDELDRALDNMYDQYKDRKLESDAKYRAKKAREQRGDDEWDGLSGSDKEDDDSDSNLEEESSDDDDEDEGVKPTTSLLMDLDSTENGDQGQGLSKRAAAFFDQDIFKGITTGAAPATQGVQENKEKIRNKEKSSTKAEIQKRVAVDGSDGSDNDGDYSMGQNDDNDSDSDWERDDARTKDGKIGKLQSTDIYATRSTKTFRHRHCYCRSHDVSTSASDWPKDYC